MADRSTTINLFDGAQARFPAQDRVALFLLEGWFESKEQTFVRRFLKEGDEFLDVGAHAGLFSILARRSVGESGRVVAVEPNAQILPWLEENLGVAATGTPGELAKRGACILAAAMGERTGEADFHGGREGFSAYSSLTANPDTVGSVRVSKFALDDLTELAGLSRLDLVKVDIEGAETLFLEGARKTLARFPNIVLMMEFSEDAQDRFGVSSKSLGDDLYSLGLKTFEISDSGDLEEIGATADLWHRNLIVARDKAMIEDRLARAPQEIQEASAYELRRGRSARDVYERATAGKNFIADVARSMFAIADISAIATGEDSSRRRISDVAAMIGASSIEQDAAAQAVLSALGDELGRLRGAAAYNAEKFDSRRKELERLEALNERSEGELRDAHSRLEQADAEIEKLREEVERLGGEIEDLAGRLRESRLEFNKIGALALAMRRSRALRLARTLNLPAGRIVEEMASVYAAQD
ncbi:MAG: FkbM family methyltransferase [Parvularculaceae bacterium]|nr:FkbM family methyltransferase [Parvularculaceae bacterium]